MDIMFQDDLKGWYSVRASLYGLNEVLEVCTHVRYKDLPTFVKSKVRATNRFDPTHFSQFTFTQGGHGETVDGEYVMRIPSVGYTLVKEDW